MSDERGHGSDTPGDERATGTADPAHRPSGVALRVTGRELGARPLIDVAVAEASARDGARASCAGSGFGEERNIPLAYRLGPVRAAELANRLDDRFGDEPRNADLEIGTADRRSRSPRLRRERSSTAARCGAVCATLPAELGVPLVTRPPLVGIDEARRAQAR